MRPVPKDLRDSLQFFDVTEHADLDLFPTFLIAGPQRTGSTWIYKQLEDHPQIQMTDPKEVYFFNLLRSPNHPQHRTDSLDTYLEYFRISPEELARRDEKSQRLFGRPYEPKARGDATASYAAGITEDRMAEIVRIAPDLKVVVTVRNPIDRAWSHAKLVIERERGHQVADVPAEEIDRILNWEYHVECGMYSRIHDRWTRHLRPGNLFFRPFEDIRDRPRQLLLDVMQFLDIDADVRFLSKEAMAGANATEAPSVVPERHRRLLEDMYREEIETIRSRFGFGLDW